MLTMTAPPLLSHGACGGAPPQDYEVFQAGEPTSSVQIASLLPRPLSASTQAFSSHDQHAAMLSETSIRGMGVPTNEMMRERTMQLLASKRKEENTMAFLEDRRASLSCSPPISPGSSLGSTSPLRETYPSPRPHDYPIATVGEASNACAGSTTTYLAGGAAVTISRQALAQRMRRSPVSLPVSGTTMHGSANSPMPASPQAVSQSYPYPLTPPTDPSVPSGLMDDIEEMLSDASSPFNNEFENEMDIFDNILGDACTEMTGGSPPLSHPPPLISRPNIYDRTVPDPRMANAVASVSPASLMGIAGQHDNLSLESSGSLSMAASYPNVMSGSPAYSYAIKKEERPGKAEVYPVVALWEFLLEALYYPCYEHILRWRNKADGHFKIVDSQNLAKLWGLYKRKRDMNFDKMSRAMRYYYDKGILEKGGSGARLEYKFGPRSNWLDFRPPPGSQAGRFFHAQPPRRGRANRNNANSSSQMTPMTPMMVVGAGSSQLRHHIHGHSPIGYGPQRTSTFQNLASIRHSPY